MSTRTDMLDAWVRLTGDPLPEARQRLRALAEAGLIPTWHRPVDYPDIARTLLGFVAATQHKEAAATVRRLSEFRCGTASGENNEVPLMRLSLLDALTTALRPPSWIVSLEVNTTTGSSCHLEVCDGWVIGEGGEAKGMPFPGPRAEYWFNDQTALPLRTPLHPVEVSRTIYCSLIDCLLTELMNHPVPPIRDGWAYPVKDGNHDQRAQPRQGRSHHAHR